MLKKRVVNPTTKIFPSKMTKSATWLTKKPRRMFEVMRVNASWEALQKFDPTIAVMMYAFLLRYLMSFSRKKKHVRRHQMIPLINLFCAVMLLILSFMYSTATLMSWIKARSNDPKATVPRWYLKVRFTLEVSIFFGSSALLNVQYQEDTAPARIISPVAEIKAAVHKAAKRLYHCRTRWRVRLP